MGRLYGIGPSLQSSLQSFENSCCRAGGSCAIDAVGREVSGYTTISERTPVFVCLESTRVGKTLGV
jgi:hypothetical protein